MKQAKYHLGAVALLFLSACSASNVPSDPPELYSRALDGSKTISYPVGVFNVNQKALGEAHDNTSFAQLWNADAEDAEIGSLIPTDTPLGFNFAPKTGQNTPESVLGMRYFKFDLPWDILDTFTFPEHSLVDFGDGVVQRFDADTELDPSVHIHNDAYVGAVNTYLNSATYNAPGSAIYLNNAVYSVYKVYPDENMKTITVFHSDNDYYLDTQNSFVLPKNGSDLMGSLRGNLPHFTKGARFTGTAQLTFNTFRHVNYEELKENFQYIEMGDGGAKPFSSYNFGTLDFSNLTALGFGSSSNFPGLIKDLVGTTNLPGKYPRLVSIELKHSQYSPDLNLKIPNFQQFILVNPTGELSVLSNDDCDRLINDLDSVKSDTGGVIYITGCKRTTASDAAAASLRAKGVAITGQL